MAEQKLGAAVSRLEDVASRLEALAAKGFDGAAASGGANNDEVAQFVVAYDDLVKNHLEKYYTISNTIGGEVKAQADLVKDAFGVQRDLLVIASKSMKPSNDALIDLIKPMGTMLESIDAIREANRHSKLSNHLFAIGESIGALAWITITPAPSPYINDMSEAAMFYSNRILKEYKGKEQIHVDWVNSWKQVLLELRDYVKAHHTTGLSWNPQGGDVKATQAAPSRGGAAPPPPPPPPGPPPPVDDLPSASKAAGEGVKNALFASINQGADITKGLKRVTDDMKTHKNPALRQGPAPFKAATPSPKPSTLPKPGAPSKPVTTVKPPVLELQGKKWIVENHKDNKSISIEGVMNQTVYAYKCEGSVINVKGKINSIVLDSCKKTAIVFEDVLSSVEFVNCQSVQGQTTGKVNTLSIDKTDGCLFYLSKDSLNIEIVTAKSSEMNISVPQPDGDFKEFALPEQYKTTYNGTTMVTTATESI